MDLYTQPTLFLNYLNDDFQEYVAPYKSTQDQKEKAIRLFEKVRDSFIYDPYHLDLRQEALTASNIIKKKRGWCVEKAIVLAAAFRACEIPSRLGFGIVVNHIGVEKLTVILKRKEIVFHGFVEAFINNQWVKTTPAFDPLVCKIAQVPLLDWNGETDALLQAYKGTDKFMEYVHFYGTFDDVPLQLMNEEMKKYYPHLFENEYNSREFSFFHL